MIISTHPNAKWATYPLFILTSKNLCISITDYTLPSQALSITPNTNYTNHYFLASLWATWSILIVQRGAEAQAGPGSREAEIHEQGILNILVRENLVWKRITRLQMVEHPWAHSPHMVHVGRRRARICLSKVWDPGRKLWLTGPRAVLLTKQLWDRALLQTLSWVGPVQRMESKTFVGQKGATLSKTIFTQGSLKRWKKASKRMRLFKSMSCQG